VQLALWQKAMEVRVTIVRTITTHLLNDSPISWVELDFDFTGAALHDADFSEVTFAGKTTTFKRATFSVERTSSDGATFSGEFTSFYGATFAGGRTRFDGATFSGESTHFYRATFSGGTPADAATVKSSFIGMTVSWGPITPRTLPSPASDT
jgi:uncharacterized protein YjbI with pentapeptide repeats